jgi:hypothetical protein
MFVQTHTRIEDNGDVYTVYRDRELNQCVTHFSAYRGGCLYIGEVVVLDQNTAKSFAFSTTSAPWGEHGADVAAAYWQRHSDKLS